MKTKILIFLSFCLIATSVDAKLVELKTSFTITRQDTSSVYIVDYVGSKVGNVTLTITDISKSAIVTKYINGTKDFSLPINFSSMHQGVYTIEIDNGTEKIYHDLTYSNSTPPTYSHILSLGDNQYLLTTSHAGNEKVIVRIFDGMGTEVYGEEQTIDGSLAVLYNLKDVYGNPTFELTDESGRSLMVPANPVTVRVKKSSHIGK